MKNLKLLLASMCLLISGTGFAETRPNILLIVSEDNGPELGCYGDPYARTPNLDRLAERGMLFSNAHVAAPVCNPSRPLPLKMQF